MSSLVSRNTNILKTESLLISVTAGRFPRAVRVPPRSLRSLRGHTRTRFSRWSRRPSLQSMYWNANQRNKFHTFIRRYLWNGLNF